MSFKLTAAPQAFSGQIDFFAPPVRKTAGKFRIGL
jgi:hypothetical protein